MTDQTETGRRETSIGPDAAEAFGRAELGRQAGAHYAWTVAALADSMIGWVPCASASWTEDNPHHMSYGLHRPGGWALFYKQQLRPVLDRGVRRLLFHLPFGKTTGQSPFERAKRRELASSEPSRAWTEGDDKRLLELGLERWHMGLDHEHDLRRTGSERILHGFYATLDLLHADYPDAEACVYLGSSDGEDQAVLDAGGAALLYRRWFRSLLPLLTLDFVSVIFDAAVGKAADHPNAVLAQTAHAFKRHQPGRWVGVESRLQTANTWCNGPGYAAVMHEDVRRRSVGPAVLPYGRYHGPCVRILEGRARGLIPPGVDESAGYMVLLASIVRDGDVPCVGVLPGSPACFLRSPQNIAADAVGLAHDTEG